MQQSQNQKSMDSMNNSQHLTNPQQYQLYQERVRHKSLSRPSSAIRMNSSQEQRPKSFQEINMRSSSVFPQRPGTKLRHETPLEKDTKIYMKLVEYQSKKKKEDEEILQNYKIKVEKLLKIKEQRDAKLAKLQNSQKSERISRELKKEKEIETKIKRDKQIATIQHKEYEQMMLKIEEGKRQIIIKKSKYDKSQLQKRIIRMQKQNEIQMRDKKIWLQAQREIQEQEQQRIQALIQRQQKLVAEQKELLIVRHQRQPQDQKMLHQLALHANKQIQNLQKLALFEKYNIKHDNHDRQSNIETQISRKENIPQRPFTAQVKPQQTSNNFLF